MACSYRSYACSNIINSMSHCPLFRTMSGKRWGFELCKIQIHRLLRTPVSQIPTVSPPQKRCMGSYERICLLMFTLLYMRIWWAANSPSIAGQVAVWCQIEVKCPIFPPCACIMNSRSWTLDTTYLAIHKFYFWFSWLGLWHRSYWPFIKCTFW